MLLERFSGITVPGLTHFLDLKAIFVRLKKFLVHFVSGSELTQNSWAAAEQLGLRIITHFNPREKGMGA